MTLLRVSDDLELPIDAVTETFAFLAKRGAGKTYAASVLAEEMLKAGVQVVVLDCLDVWWGLRTSADGKGPGLPIAIFGGSHGDIPLEPTAGGFMARLIVENRLSAVLVVEQWSKGDQRRFATDFLETLFQLNHEAMHLILEEADRWAPQKPMKGEERLLGASEEIVRRGRSKGIGCSLVTQRSAVLHKDVLTQTEVLVGMRTPAKHDLDAIQGWFKAHDDNSDVAKVMQDLPRLPTGTAWVSSPYWLSVLARVQFRRRETFDSSSTPKVGEARVRVGTIADIDLGAIRAEMEETIQRAEASDPARLQKRIRQLEAELAEARKATKEVHVVPTVLMEKLRELRETLSHAMDTAAELGALAGEEVDDTLHTIVVDGPVRQPQLTAPPTPGVRRAVRGRESARPTRTGVLPDRQQDIVDALAWFDSVGIDPVDRNQLALFAGASPKSSAYSNNLGALRTAGMIDYPRKGMVTMQPSGWAVATVPNVPKTTEGLHAQLFAKLPKPQAAILQALIPIYPDSIHRDGLAAAAGASATSSAYSNNLGALRTLGLIDYPLKGWVAAREILFLDQ